MAKIWRGRITLASPQCKFWGGGRVRPVPQFLRLCQNSSVSRSRRNEDERWQLRSSPGRSVRQYQCKTCALMKVIRVRTYTSNDNYCILRYASHYLFYEVTNSPTLIREILIGKLKDRKLHSYCTWHPLSHGTPSHIPMYFIFLENRSISLHFAADNISLS